VRGTGEEWWLVVVSTPLQAGGGGDGGSSIVCVSRSIGWCCTSYHVHPSFVSANQWGCAAPASNHSCYIYTSNWVVPQNMPYIQAGSFPPPTSVGECCNCRVLQMMNVMGGIDGIDQHCQIGCWSLLGACARDCTSSGTVRGWW